MVETNEMLNEFHENFFVWYILQRQNTQPMSRYSMHHGIQILNHLKQVPK